MKKYIGFGVGAMLVWIICTYFAASAFVYKATLSNIFDIFSNSESALSDAAYSELLSQDGHRFWNYSWLPYVLIALSALTLLAPVVHFIFLKIKKQPTNSKVFLLNIGIAVACAAPLLMLAAACASVKGFVKNSNEITLVEENEIAATVQKIEEDCDQEDNCRYALTVDVEGVPVKLVTTQDNIEENDNVYVIESKMHSSLTKKDSVEYRLKDKKKKRKRT